MTSALSQTDRAEEAVTLGEDTLRRCRDTLGPNHHPTTLAAAIAVTWAMSHSGRTEQAIRLGEDTLRRCQLTLGPDHPTTSLAAAAVAVAASQDGAELAREPAMTVDTRHDTT